MKNIIFFLCLFFLFSCKRSIEQNIVVIWTNKVEITSYCEAFNTEQNKYKVIVEYKENPANEILNATDTPDIVISQRLKGKDTRVKFKPLNYLLKKKIDSSYFYGQLLL